MGWELICMTWAKATGSIAIVFEAGYEAPCSLSPFSSSDLYGAC